MNTGNLTPDQMVIITLLGGYVYTLVNVLKPILKWRDAKVLVLVAIVSVVLAAVIVFSLFEAVRLYVYAALNLFVNALGVKESSRQKDQGGLLSNEDAQPEPPPAPSPISQPVATSHGVADVSQGGITSGQ